jgi:phosphocarrier protein HPr
MTSSNDFQRTVTIANRHGLHARPAAEFVKLASTFDAEILVRKDDLEVSGKSIMGIMMLAAEYGSAITIRARGAQAEAAVGGLAGLVERRFGED